MAASVNTPVQVPAFRELLRRIEADAGEPVALDSPRSFELLMPGDLPVRATLHPADDRLVIDCYVYNAQLVTGPLRRALCQTLLLLNHAGLRGRPFAIGLDRRDYVFVSTTLPLDDAGLDGFAGQLAYLCEQAAEVRELVATVTLADAELEGALLVQEPA